MDLIILPPHRVSRVSSFWQLTIVKIRVAWCRAAGGGRQPFLYFKNTVTAYLAYQLTRLTGLPAYEDTSTVQYLVINNKQGEIIINKKKKRSIIIIH